MSLPTFVTSDPFAVGETVTLGEDEAHHIRVRRLEIGERVGLLDGRGASGTGVLVRLAKRHAAVTVQALMTLEPPPSVHLLLPVAERERMLWLAEKATELGATSWRPVLWKHSRSVHPRGEGPVFQQKVAARMAGALESVREYGAGRIRPITIAVGPEGGIEEHELAALVKAGFRAVSIGNTILRFETAAVAALAVVRSALATLPPTIKGVKEEATNV